MLGFKTYVLNNKHNARFYKPDFISTQDAHIVINVQPWELRFPFPTETWQNPHRSVYTDYELVFLELLLSLLMYARIMSTSF